MSQKFVTLEEAILEFQRKNFGSRYHGATLSKLDTTLEAANLILNYTRKPKGLLVYHGSPGTGKTYLCSALTEWGLKAFNSRRYHREEDLLRKLRAGISEGNGDYLISLQYLIDDELVMLDDVGSGINPKKLSYRDLEFRREVFLSFLDYRYSSQRPTIITSNFTKDDFQDVYSERIISRLFAAENTIVSLFGDGLDKRTQGY